MRKSRIFPIMFIAGASVLTGAPVKHSGSNAVDSTEVVDLFVNLVKLVGSGDSIRSDSLDNLPSAVQSNTTMPDTIPLGVFDFISSVYEDKDYYESGYWGKEEESAGSAYYTGALPEYVGNDFHAPVRGIVTSRFGLRPGRKNMHKGVDIALKKGDTVRVALGGKVESVGYQKRGYGHFVIVAHPDGIQTRYAHLQKPLVARGAMLKAGDAVAIGGTSGNSTGPHLHFEIRCNKLPVDPLPLLNRQQSKVPGKAKSNTAKRVRGKK